MATLGGTRKKKTRKKRPNFDGAFDRDLDRLSAIWEVKENPPTDEWVASNIWFSPKAWASAGYWNHSLFPYSRGPLKAFDDPQVREIVLMWATQTGKTAILGALISKAAVFALFASQIACPDEKSALEHQQTKLIPVLQSVEAIAPKIKPESRRTKRLVDIGDALIYYSWSARWTVSGRAAAFIAITEANLHSRRKDLEADPIEMVRDRVKGFGGQHKIFIEGKPSVEGECRMERAYSQSNQQLYYVRCPHCNGYQSLELGDAASDFGLKWKVDANGDVLPEEVYYLCRVKHCRIDPGHKANMLRSGLWVPKGCAVEDGRLVGTPIRGPERSGFQLDSLYSNAVPWHEYAAEFLRAKRSGIEAMKNFVQGWQARPWKYVSSAIQPADIESHCGDYRPGQLTENPLCILCGIDVQKDHFWYVVCAYGYYSETWLVRYGRLETWEQVEELLRQDYHAPNGDASRVNLCLIDSGDGHRTQEVYDFCVSHYPLCAPIKGAAQYSLSSPVRKTSIADHGDLKLWNIDKGHAMDSLFLSRLKVKRGDPGYFWLPDKRYIHEDLMRSLMSWRQESAKTKSVFSVKKTRWVSTSDAYEHLADALSYCEAAAADLGLQHYKRPEATPAEKRPTARPTESQGIGNEWWRRRGGKDFWG